MPDYYYNGLDDDNDQDVDGSLWLNIMERYGLIIFINNICGYSAVPDITEQAISHFDSPCLLSLKDR